MKISKVLLVFMLSLFAFSAFAIELDQILELEMAGNFKQALKAWGELYRGSESEMYKYVAVNRIYDLAYEFNGGKQQAEEFFSQIKDNDIHARFFLFYLKRSRGEPDNEIFTELNIPRNYVILGPLDHAGLSGITEIEKGEEGILGKNRVVVPQAVNFPYPKLYFDDITGEGSFTRARADHYFSAASSGEFVIRFSFSGAVAIFIDGKQIFSGEILNNQGTFLYTAKVKLSKGLHRLRIFSAVEQTSWFVNLSFDKRLKIDRPKSRISGKINGWAVTELFKDFSPADQQEKVMWLLANRYMKHFNKEEKVDVHIVEELLTADPDFSWGYFILGQLSEDTNDSFHYYSKLKRSHPFMYGLLTARLFYDSRDYNLAWERIAPWTERNEYASRLALDTLSSLNWDSEYEKFYSSLSEKEFHSGLFKSIFDRLTKTRTLKDLLSEAELILEEEPYSFYDVSYSLRLLLESSDRRNPVYLKMLKKNMELYPYNSSNLINLARTYQSLGMDAELVELLGKMRKTFLYEEEYHKILADRALTMGKKEDALKELRSLLSWKPQDVEVIELVSELSEQKDLAYNYYDHASIDLNGEYEIPEKFRNSDIVQLYERNILEVKPSNLMITFKEMLFQVNRVSGIERLNYYPIYYNGSSEYVQIDSVLVIAPDGTLFPVNKFRSGSVGASGNVYSDYRRLGIYIDDLSIGSRVYIKFRTIQFSNRSFKDHFPGEILNIQDDFPSLLKEYFLLYPKGKRLVHKFYNTKVKTQKSVREGFNVVSWKLKDQEQIAYIPNMASYSEYGPYLSITMFKGWNEVYDWVKSLFKERLKPTKAVKDEYAKLGIAPDSGFKQKVEKIFKYVSQDIHYLGIEYGLNGYQPRFPSKVIREKFGDCKDKATLMKVFLKMAGIDSNITLIRTKDIGDIETLPVLTVFNHAVLTVYSPKGLPYVVDPTVEWGLPWELPRSLLDAFAMEMDDNGFRMKKVKKNPGQTDQTIISNRCVLSSDLKLSFVRSFEKSGYEAFRARHLMENEQTAQEDLQSIWSGRYARAVVKDIELLSELWDSPVKYRYGVDIWNFVSADTMKFSPFIYPISFYETYALLDTIDKPIELGLNSTSRTETEIVLPDDFKIASLPKYTDIENKLMSVKVGISRKDQIITLKYSVRFKKDLIVPEDYELLKNSLLKFKEMMDMEVILEQ